MPYKMMGTMMSWVKQDVAESPLYALLCLYPSKYGAKL